jgi:uncharacterized protein (DUF427 family)
MSLTLGTAPFARHPAGSFNVVPDRPAHALYFETSPRRVRGVLAGETAVDSRDVKLLHETGLLPVWYFPDSNVRADLLQPSDHHTTCPFKGEASYRSLTVGDRVVENAAWYYPNPIAGAPPLAGHLALYWHAMDAWFEEDEQVFVHPRDPYHRVDAVPTSRHIVVGLDGVTLAETRRATAVFETSLPTRWYVPVEDVRQELLVPTPTSTRCPYKGLAGYWSVAAAGASGVDVVWSYPDPIAAVRGIAGQLCFFNERVDIDVDGFREPRPQTQWSPGADPDPHP